MPTIDLSTVSVPQERYFVLVWVRDYYCTYFGWCHETKKLEIGVDAQLTGRMRITNGDQLALEVQFKNLERRERQPTSRWDRFKQFFGISDEYESVEVVDTRWVSDDSFSWQAITDCTGDPMNPIAEVLI